MLNNNNLHYDLILHACRPMLIKVGRQAVVHCFRDQNSIADALAKEAAKKEFFGSTRIFAVPPMYVMKAIWKNILGSTYARNVNLYDGTFLYGYRYGA